MYRWIMQAAISGWISGFAAGSLIALLALLVVLVRRGTVPRPHGYHRVLAALILVALGFSLSGVSQVLSAVNDGDRQLPHPGLQVHAAVLVGLDAASGALIFTGLAIGAVTVGRRNRLFKESPRPDAPTGAS